MSAAAPPYLLARSAKASCHPAHVVQQLDSKLQAPMSAFAFVLAD